MTLRLRLTLAILAIIGTLGLCQYLLTVPAIRHVLWQSLDDKGASLANALAAQVVESLLTEDDITLQLLFSRACESDPDIRYIFVLDGQGRVRVHTFSQGFPADLIAANPLGPDAKAPRHRHLVTEQGLVHDTAVPLVGGKAGVLRVGLGEDQVTRLVRRTSRTIFLTTLVLGLVGVVLVIVFTDLLTRPLRQLEEAAQRFGRGDLTSRMPQATGDIGRLARTFNTMADQLSATIASLEQTRERLAAIFNDAAVGITLSDLEGHILEVNPAFARMLGYPAAELKGVHISQVTMSEDRGGQMEKYKKLLAGEIDHIHFQKRYLHRQGRPIWAQVTLSLLRDGQGAPAMVIGMIEDITSRKLLEEERLKAGRLESIEVLAGGIAHDFNNLLTAILGNIILAQHKAGDDQQMRELLKAAETASLRAKKLTDQLLLFAHGSTPTKQRLDLAALAEETARLVLAGSEVALATDFAPDLAQVEVDPGQLRQVIQNIVTNAVQAMGGRGTLTLAADTVTVGRTSSLAAGRYLRLTITDQGHGINPEHLDRVFDPYYTTREKGDGLGLAISYSIVKNHDGMITVTSTPGQGASFVIYLPAVPGTGAEPAPETENTRHREPDRS